MTSCTVSCAKKFWYFAKLLLSADDKQIALIYFPATEVSGKIILKIQVYKVGQIQQTATLEEY